MVDKPKLSERVRKCAVPIMWPDLLAELTGAKKVPEALALIADGIAELESHNTALENDNRRLRAENERFTTRRMHDRANIDKLDAERSQLLEERDRYRDSMLDRQRELNEANETIRGYQKFMEEFAARLDAAEAALARLEGGE